MRNTVKGLFASVICEVMSVAILPQGKAWQGRPETNIPHREESQQRYQIPYREASQQLAIIKAEYHTQSKAAYQAATKHYHTEN
jgi:hypothetical protein